MMIDNVAVGVLALLLAALLAGALYLRIVLLELGHARKESSRFPLFGARTQLVALVADGLMDESNPAWRRQYGAVNALLGMHQSLNIVDFAWRLVRFQVRVHTDPKARAAFETMKRQTEAAALRCPEFVEACKRSEAAIIYLVGRRSTRLQFLFVRGSIAALLTILTAISAGLQTARLVGNALAHQPTARDVLNWQMTVATA